MTLSYSAKKKLQRNAAHGLINVLRTILILGIAFVILYPLVTKIAVSLMPLEDVYDMSVHYLPKHVTLKNYRNAWNFLKIPSLAFNSIFIPLLVSAVQTVFTTIVAYGFARFDFKGKNFFFVMVVMSMVIPPDITLMPLYINFRFFDFSGGLLNMLTGWHINVLNTPIPYVLLGMTCTGLKNGLYIFILRQYFRGLPKELEEAAYVDGASVPQAFFSVFLASASQVMMTVFLFSFVWQWLDDIYTSVFMQNVPMLVTELSRLFDASTGEMMGISSATEFSLMRNCGMLFLIVPVLLLYMFCQKYFTESLERSGLVG